MGDTRPRRFCLIRRRHWFVHLLSLALLFAQLGMVVHAGTHYADEREPPAAQACDYCVSSHAMQHMAGAGTGFDLTVSITRDPAAEVLPALAPASTRFTAFRSRAPPQVL